MRRADLGLAVILGLLAFGGGLSSAMAEQVSSHISTLGMNMKIAITVHGKKEAHLTATMVDNETTRDFLALLPLNLQLGDLFGREKYGQLSKALSTKGKKQFTYKVGQIVYWSPSHDVAIYYKDDGEAIPSPGIIVMGQLDATATPLDVPGTIGVTIDRAK